MHNQTATCGQDSTESFRLLVIDDDLIQRTIISKLGRQAGFDVTAAATFDEAVDLLKTCRFDCITLDLSLGEQSGALLLRNIADSSVCIPVMVISGAEEHVLRSTVSMAQSFGLDSLPFPKPLNLAQLRNALTKKRQDAPGLRGLIRMSQPSQRRSA